MRSTFNILFFIKKNEVKRNGLCTIMVRITIDGVYLQFSTKTDISPAYWITKHGRAKGCTQYANELNRQLDGIRTGLHMHHSRLRDKYKYVTPLMLKKAFLAIEDETKLGYQFSEQVKFFQSKTGKNIGSNTSFRYGLTWKRIQEFLEKEHNISDIQMDRISLGFLEKFYTFMRKDLNYENNTAMKYMQRFSTIMSFSEKLGLISHNPFHFYVIRFNKTDRVTLIQEEVDRIWKKDFRTSRLAIIRDLFIFSCYTGLSYIDICRLKKDDIQLSSDNKHWISIHRMKTDGVSQIPLLPVPLQIIEKYKEVRPDDLLFPLTSNQKTNEYLKEIAEICHINKKVTFHVARHTFATLALSNKVSVESISSMLGHSSIKTTQIYAKITPLKISNEMQEFEQSLTNHSNSKKIPAVSDTSQQIRYKILEIALKMKMKGLDNNQIVYFTGLPIDIVSLL